MQESKPLLGAHISISKGFLAALQQAEQLGCTALQFFSKSNRQWYAKPISTAESAQFKQALSTSPVQSITIHASYLINIGSPEEAISNKATQALEDELLRAQQLSANNLVLHPGSRKDSDQMLCLQRIANNINKVLSRVQTNKEPSTKILLETMAGQGKNVGNTFEQLAYIMKHIEQKDRIGICLDTCHIFAAGYELRTQDTYKQTLQAFDDIIGLNNLYAIHLNDSKGALASRIDRHEHIGKGEIPLSTFRFIMQDTRLKHIPKIIETPKNNLFGDKENLETLARLI